MRVVLCLLSIMTIATEGSGSRMFQNRRVQAQDSEGPFAHEDNIGRSRSLRDVQAVEEDPTSEYSKYSEYPNPSYRRTRRSKRYPWISNSKVVKYSLVKGPLTKNNFGYGEHGSRKRNSVRIKRDKVNIEGDSVKVKTKKRRAAISRGKQKTLLLDDANQQGFKDLSRSKKDCNEDKRKVHSRQKSRKKRRKMKRNWSADFKESSPLSEQGKEKTSWFSKLFSSHKKNQTSKETTKLFFNDPFVSEVSSTAKVNLYQQKYDIIDPEVESLMALYEPTTITIQKREKGGKERKNSYSVKISPPRDFGTRSDLSTFNDDCDHIEESSFSGTTSFDVNTGLELCEPDPRMSPGGSSARNNKIEKISHHESKGKYRHGAKVNDGGVVGFRETTTIKISTADEMIEKNEVTTEVFHVGASDVVKGVNETVVLGSKNGTGEAVSNSIYGGSKGNIPQEDKINNRIFYSTSTNPSLDFKDVNKSSANATRKPENRSSLKAMPATIRMPLKTNLYNSSILINNTAHSKPKAQASHIGPPKEHSKIAAAPDSNMVAIKFICKPEVVQNSTENLKGNGTKVKTMYRCYFGGPDNSAPSISSSSTPASTADGHRSEKKGSTSVIFDQHFEQSTEIFNNNGSADSWMMIEATGVRARVIEKTFSKDQQKKGSKSVTRRKRHNPER